ncbi:PREDICTED: olfactory receptor 6N2-like [Nanorana parkeri]|uniref:olfactory receptor 6N2-like n=1 Tax=Nanorana parkeri TaxID=125878 RepID=UPI000854BD67|nr:PREDICTED: olfactory receptor 6N2-like [Nanorana parkeri]
MYNQSISEFIIVGFTNIVHHQQLLFTLMLLLYLIIITSNIIILLAILFDSHLHVPMYYFICALCLSEMGIVITVYPTMFTLVLNGKAHISFNYCLLQMYIFHSLSITENYLLNVMAYDRYVAICKALRYHAIMTLKSSKLLIAICWILGFLTPLAYLILVNQLPFCGANVIQHLFCDSSPLLNLACANNDLTIIMDFTLSSFTIILTSFSIIITYANILAAILKMKTSEERKKAFSTCASHLIIAFIFYGSIAFMYVKLQTNYSPELDLATAIHHSILTPLLSPFVYSFRNKDIQSFLKRFFQRKKGFAENIHVSFIS